MARKTRRYFLPSIAGLAIIMNAVLFAPVEACTRATYLGSDGVVITGRTMDWMEDLRTNLWAFPRGIARNGAAGPRSPAWVSKYGSVVASAYDLASVDGMNEKGLVANLLWLAESEYGATDGKPPLSISMWAQYVLDNFAAVEEAVAALQTEPFRIVVPDVPDLEKAQLHLSISDASGDSAIFEYIDGKLVIHHGRRYQVMTNSPDFKDQLALNAYWKQMGGLVFLPGTNRAADRFVRASFLIDAIPKDIDPHYITAVPERRYLNQAVASVFGVMRAVSVPLGITTPNAPNISSTLWRSVSDQKNRVYFFDSATSPNVFWVALADLDLKQSAPIRKLTLTGGKIYTGNAANKFKAAKSFNFVAAAAP